MFEKQLSDILATNLRRFIRDLNEEQLQISLWSGDLVLRDLQLQPDILDQVALLVFQNQKSATDVIHSEGSFLFSLGDTIEDAAAAQALLLPFTVVKGKINELAISVPWSSLDCEPVSVEVRGVELVFGPLRSRETDPEEERARLEVMKQRHLGQFEHERDLASSATEERDSGGTGTDKATPLPTARRQAHPAPAEKQGGAASSLGSAIASMSFFEQLVQTITRNVHVVVRDVSVAHIFDYNGLHRSLASAVSLWIEEIVVTTTDEAFQDRFVMDLTMPVCKAVHATGIRVAVHDKRRENEEAFSCISLHARRGAPASPTALHNTQLPPSTSDEVPASADKAAVTCRDRFFQHWERSETLLELDELQLHIKRAPEHVAPAENHTRGVAGASSAKAGDVIVTPAHTSLAVTLGNALKARLSFGSLLILESLARSLQDGLVGAPFRPQLHLLQDTSPVASALAPRKTAAQRRWAFAIACVRDVLARNTRQGHTTGSSSTPTGRTPGGGGGGKPLTSLQAMVAFGKVRREYCGLWKRSQQVSWLPPLDVAERQQMLAVEKCLTLEQVVFLRCMAYAELSVDAEAARQQRLFVESARARKLGLEHASSGTNAGRGGLLGWFRRTPASPNDDDKRQLRGDDIVDLAELPGGNCGTVDAQAPKAYNPRHHFCQHLAAEFDVGRRFLARKLELRAAAAAAQASTSTATATSPTADVVQEADLTVAVVEGDSPVKPSSVPPMVLHVRCRRLQLTLVPEYWDPHQSEKAFLSNHVEQNLTCELRSLELFLDNVQEAREDRAGVSFFVASVEAWFEGTFATPLFWSRGRLLPAPQGREDFLTFKQNAARTRRTLVISPSVLVLRPFHEMLWWGTELMDFGALLASRLGRSSRFLSCSRQDMAPPPVAAATRATASSTPFAESGMARTASRSPLPAAAPPTIPPALASTPPPPPPASVDVTVHSIDILVPLFAHDLPVPGTKAAPASRRADPNEVSALDTPSHTSTTATRPPPESSCYDSEPDAAGDDGDNDADIDCSSTSASRPDGSYNDFDGDTRSAGDGRRQSSSVPVAGDVVRDGEERLSMARGSRANSFAAGGTAGCGGRTEHEGSRLHLRPPITRGDTHSRHRQEERKAARERAAVQRRRETMKSYFDGDACLVLSVPAVQVKTMRGEERRFRGCESRGQEYFIAIGDQRKAMRLYCQTGSSPFTKSQKIEVVSLSVIQILVNPDEVAVGVYNGAELTVDPAAFALLNDHLFKPLELYGSANLAQTHSLLHALDKGAERRASAPTTQDKCRFNSSTELFLTHDSLMTLPTGQGREYATLLHRWWLTRRRRRHHQHPTTTAAAPQQQQQQQPLPPLPQSSSFETHQQVPPRCTPPPPTGPAKTTDLTVCVEFVRVILRNAKQEDVGEIELMVPSVAPPCTHDYRSAFSVFSDAPHGVEILVRSETGGKAVAAPGQRSASPGSTRFVLVSIPDTAVSTAVGKPLSNLELLSVTLDEATGCNVKLQEVSLHFGVEVAECVETLFGVVKTLQLAPLPLPPLDTAPVVAAGQASRHPSGDQQQQQPSSAAAARALTPPLRFTVAVDAITAQFPLSSQPDQPYRALSATTRALLLDVDRDETGATSIALSGYVKEVLRVDEDVDNGGVTHFTLVGSSTGMLGQSENLSYQFNALLPPATNTTTDVPHALAGQQGASCTVRATGGYVCLNAPFMLRCIDAINDPLYMKLLALGHSSTFQHGLSFSPRGGVDVEAFASGVGQRTRPPEPAVPEPFTFSADVTNVEVLLATDANLPVDITDDSTFFYLSLGRMAAVQKLVPLHQHGVAAAAAGTEERHGQGSRRLSLTLGGVSYSPLSDRAPVALPLEVTVDVDFGVLLVPRADLSGYEYKPGDSRNDFTILVSVDRPAAASGSAASGSASSSGTQSAPPTIDVVLPPSRVAALLRAVTLNLIQFPSPLPRADKNSPDNSSSTRSTPRRPKSPAQRGIHGEELGESPILRAAGFEATTTATPAAPPVMTTPSVAIMLTIPSLRMRLLTEDHRVFSLKIDDGVQYYRAAGGQWARCPAQNLQLRTIVVEEVLEMDSHGNNAAGTGSGRGSGEHTLTGKRCLTLLHINRVGCTALVSIDAAPVRGAPNYMRVDAAVDAPTVHSHILAWSSVLTLLSTQIAPITALWPTTENALRQQQPPLQSHPRLRQPSPPPLGADRSVASDTPHHPPSTSNSVADPFLPAPGQQGSAPQYEGRFTPSLDPASSSPAVYVLSEVSVGVVNARLLFLKGEAEALEQSGTPHTSPADVAAVATLCAPRTVVAVVQSSDESAKWEATVAEPPTLTVVCDTATSGAGDKASHAAAAAEFHLLEWEPRSREEAASRGYVKVVLTSRTPPPLRDAPLLRAARVGELISTVPIVQTPNEVTISVQGLRVQVHMQPCCVLAGYVTHHVLPNAEKAAALHRRLMGAVTPPPTVKSFAPQRTALLFFGDVANVRVAFMAPSGTESAPAVVGCAVIVEHASVSSSLVQSPVEGLDTVVATAPVKNAFGWSLQIAVDVGAAQLVCIGAATTDVDEAADESFSCQATTPIDLPTTRIQLRLPLCTTTFMEVLPVNDESDPSSSSATATALGGQAPMVEYVFPPPTIYGNGRATFVRLVACEVGGPSCPVVALSPGHILHLAKTWQAVQEGLVVSGPFRGTDPAPLHHPAPHGEEEDGGETAKTTAPASVTFKSRLEVKCELLSGLTIRAMETRSLALAELQLLDPAVATFCEGKGWQAALLGRFDLTDKHGSVLLSRHALDRHRESNRGNVGTPPAAIQLSATGPDVSMDTDGIVVRLTPALVDVALTTCHLLRRLKGHLPDGTARQGPMPFTAPPSTAGGTPCDRSTEPPVSRGGTPSIPPVEATEARPPLPPLRFKAHVWSVGFSFGDGGGLVVARDFVLDAADPFFLGQAATLALSLRHVSVIQPATHAARGHVEAGPVTVTVSPDTVHIGVEACVVRNLDGFFWGDLTESALVFFSCFVAHLLPLLPRQAVDPRQTSQTVHCSLSNTRLCLHLNHSSSPSENRCVVDCAVPHISVKQVSKAGGASEFGIEVEDAYVTAPLPADPAQGGAYDVGHVPAATSKSAWKLLKKASASLSMNSVPTGSPAGASPRSAVAVRFSAVDCALPLGDTLQRCSEAVSLLLLQFVPSQRFINAVSRHPRTVRRGSSHSRHAGTQEQVVVEVTLDDEGSMVSSLHDRSTAASTTTPFAAAPDATVQDQARVVAPGTQSSPHPTAAVPESHFTLHLPLIAVRVCRELTRTSSSPSERGGAVVCGVEVHNVSAAFERTPRGAVSSLQIAQITSTSDPALQDEFLTATAPADSLDATSRVAVYVHREDRTTPPPAALSDASSSSSSSSSMASEQHRVVARVHALRMTLSPGLLFVLNDSLFARVAAGVSFARLSAAGLYGAVGLPSSIDHPHAMGTASDTGPDDDRNLEDIPEGEEMEEDGGMSDDVDGDVADAADSTGQVITITTNLRLQEDLVLGGRRGPRLHFSKKTVAETGDDAGAVGGASSRNVLTVKSVNHARLLLSMVELTPQGLQCAPITVDEGLTVRVEGTQVVLESEGSSTVQDYVVLGDRSLFVVPESLVVHAAQAVPGSVKSPTAGQGQQTTSAAEAQEEATRLVAGSGLRRNVLTVTTDIDIYADVTLQLWSSHQTVAVLAETVAKYHATKVVSEGGVTPEVVVVASRRNDHPTRQQPNASGTAAATPRPHAVHQPPRWVEFMDEVGEIALQRVRVLCDSGPITASPATLVVNVKHHKLAEDATNAGVTVVKAVMPPVRFTISTGHLKLFYDIAWQLRTGTAHLETVVKPEELFVSVMAALPPTHNDDNDNDAAALGNARRDLPQPPTPASPFGPPHGEERDVVVPPVSPTRRRYPRGSNSGVASTAYPTSVSGHTRRRFTHTAAGLRGRPRPMYKPRRHDDLAASAVTHAPLIEFGLTVPAVEVVITNDFFRPELTFHAGTVSVLAKGQRDGSACSCVATAALTMMDHPPLEPPRTLLSVAPEVSADYLFFTGDSGNNNNNNNGGGGGKSLKVALACSEVSLTVPVLSALRLMRYDFGRQRTGAFAFRNQLGIPIVLGSSGGAGSSSSGATAGQRHEGKSGGDGVVFCELPTGSTVKPGIFHYNQTRFRVIPGDEAVLSDRSSQQTPCVVRRLLMRGTEVDISSVEKGATYRFPLLDTSISAGGVADVVMRLDEAERVVSFTSAIKLVNQLSNKVVSLPGDLLNPLAVPPGESRYVPFTALQQPFCVVVEDLRSTTSIPPLLTLQSMISAFVLREEDAALGTGSQARRQADNLRGQPPPPRVFWNHAYAPDSGTLVMPLLLSHGVPSSSAPSPTSPPEAATGEAVLQPAQQRVVNLVWRKQMARESQPRTARLLAKYDVELCVQPVASLINLTGATLHVELFTNAVAPQTPSGSGATAAAGAGKDDSASSGALAHGEHFDWFPTHLEETAFAPHALLELALGTQRLRSVGPVELSSAAADASRVVAMLPTASVSAGSNAEHDVSGDGGARGRAGAALVFERMTESVIAVKALATVVNWLPYSVHVCDLAYRPALMGRGKGSVLPPGEQHPLFLPCPPTGRAPKADTPVSLCVAVVAGRQPTKGETNRGGVKPSEPFTCTAPSLSALLSSEENECEHYFTANLTYTELPRSLGTPPLTQRIIALQPAFVVHNANPTVTLVIHSPGLDDAENLVVPPLQSVEVVDFGLCASSKGGTASKGDPELVFCYASHMVDWQYAWSPPVRLTTLATAGVPATFKHRLYSATPHSQSRHPPGSTAATDEEGRSQPESPGASAAARRGARLLSAVRVPQRHGDSPSVEWFSSLTLTPSSANGQTVVSVDLDTFPPLVVENRTPHRVQFEQKLLTAVGGTVLSPTSSSLMTSLSSAQQFLWGYLVEPYTDAVGCWDAAALEAPAVQISAMMSGKAGRFTGSRTTTATCLVDLHKAEAAKETIRIADNVFAFVSHDYRQRCFYVTITEDRVLEARLIFQPRLVAHVELFVRELRLYIASTCVPAGTSSLEQTRFASLARKNLLNINYSVTPESTEAEVLAALKRKEMDLLLVRVVGLFSEGTWNERYALSHMTVQEIDVMDCTTPHPVYPLVIHMSGRRSDASGAESSKAQERKRETEASPPAASPPAPLLPCFLLSFQARRPHVSTRQVDNYYTIRGANPQQLRAIQSQIRHLHRLSQVAPCPAADQSGLTSQKRSSGTPARQASPPSRERNHGASLPVMTRLVTVPIERLHIGFGDVTLKLHDSFLFAVRQAAETAVAEQHEWASTTPALAALRDGEQGEPSSLGELLEWETPATSVAAVTAAAAAAYGEGTESLANVRALSHNDGRVSVLTVYDCYVTHLHVSPVGVEVTLTRRTDGKCNPFVGLPIGSFAIPSVDTASLSFRGLVLRDINQRGPSLTRLAAAVLWPAYRTQVIVQGCKLLGSLEALGNPMALLGGWGRGVRCLVQGTVEKDFMTGARGFWSETRTSTLRHVGLLSRLGGRTLAALTRTAADEDWLESPEARDGSVYYGIARGLTSAVGSAIGEPVAGARSSGMRGFMTGVSKGFVGLLTKPMAGLLYSVGSAADLYSQPERAVPVPAELHLQYLGADRNFPPIVLAAPTSSSLSSSSTVQGPLAQVNSATLAALSPAESRATTPIGATTPFHTTVGNQATSPLGSPRGTAGPGLSSQRHTRSSSSLTATSPATASWRGAAEASADFVSAATFDKCVAKITRQRRIVSAEVARRVVAEVGPHNFALHASYEEFRQYATPEEFYNWFPVALGALLARATRDFLDRMRKEEREESLARASGAQLAVDGRSTRPLVAEGADNGGASALTRLSPSARARNDAEVERARNIKATLGIRTLLKYVSLEYLVQVCTIAEIRAHISPEDFQERCGVLLARSVVDTLMHFLTLQPHAEP